MSNKVLIVSSEGTSGQVLTSNGVGVAPSFQDAGGGGGSSFRATKSSQTISSGSYVKVQCNIEVIDTSGDYGNSINYRFTPSVLGEYLLSATGYFTYLNAYNQCKLAIYKNGSLYEENIYNMSSSSGVPPFIPLSVLASANGTTDYFEIYAYHNRGSNAAIAHVAFNGFLVE